jgi:hypothetical protein
VAEAFHLVIAEEHSHIGSRLLEDLRQTLNRRTAGGVPALPDLEGNLLLEVLTAAQLDELVEGPHPASIVMLPAPVVGNAQVPAFRGRREHRSVRGADRENDVCHGCQSLKSRRALSS